MTNFGMEGFGEESADVFRGGETAAPLSIGALIDTFVSCKNEYEELQAQAKSVKDSMDNLEAHILTLMEEAGVSQTGTAKATVTKKVAMHGKVTDMGALLSWCVENGRQDMIQKRVSDLAFREVFEQTGSYPDGTDAFVESKITITRR